MDWIRELRAAGGPGGRLVGLATDVAGRAGTAASTRRSSRRRRYGAGNSAIDVLPRVDSVPRGPLDRYTGAALRRWASPRWTEFVGLLKSDSRATINRPMIDFDFRPAQAVKVGQHQSMCEYAQPSDLPPRGWYGDPASSAPLRYWTGASWADGGTDDPPR